jgi:hypothetical protein
METVEAERWRRGMCWRDEGGASLSWGVVFIN